MPFYSNLDPKNITDNKKFWKTMKPFFTSKSTLNSTFTIIDNGKIISEDNEVANVLNSFFEKSVSSLEIDIPKKYTKDCKDIEDPIYAIITKFSHHPSILKINGIVNKQKFSFRATTLTEIEQEISILSIKKANPSNSVSSKELKENVDVCGRILHNIINYGISNNTFDNGMKLADITPIHKKDDKTDKKNYRPVSGLSAGSKIFKRVIQNQIGEYANKFLSQYLCGYRKGYSVQHALMLFLETWRVALDNRGHGGAILMDLSKAFDTLDHELLIAKLNAYGFEKNSLTLIRSYLSNRWHRTRINDCFSTWSELINGVPQGSVLGPLLFNIYLNDLFFLDIEADICNFADDNTLFACDVSMDKLIEKLESSAITVIEWFKNNHMELNESKCHLLFCGNSKNSISVNVGSFTIEQENEVNLLGIVIDKQLKFDNHIYTIYKKAGNKLNALGRLCNILLLQKRKILMKAFVISQFSFSPLVGMFHSRELNSKINALHYRALKMAYGDDTSSFSELLIRDNSVTIHHRNIQILAIELFKVKLGVSSPFM